MTPPETSHYIVGGGDNEDSFNPQQDEENKSQMTPSESMAFT